MAHQLNLTRHKQLNDGKLGRQAWLESSVSAVISGLCSFGGALVPLAIASVIPSAGGSAIVATLACLGVLGAGIGYTTASCKICWGLALMLAGGLLAALGYFLHIV
jgi:VIT1/CCC1 family predicted Fe2+/Mn2+ transporter